MSRDAQHAGGWQDKARRQANIDAENELCERCDGTGNELYSMYKPCTDCGGTGAA